MSMSLRVIPGLVFRCGNVVTYGWPEHWIRALGHRILKLDIKEFSRSKANTEGPYAGFGVPLGEGDCDWPAVNEALSEIGYQGWATAEVSGGDRTYLEGLAARMDIFCRRDRFRSSRINKNAT